MLNRETFRNNLNHLLSIKCLKQTDIAYSLGVSRSTVSRWCDGSMIPSGRTLIALSDYLSVTPSMLMGDKSSLTQIDEERLLHDFRMLSPKGKELALERMDELMQLHYYDNERIAK